MFVDVIPFKQAAWRLSFMCSCSCTHPGNWEACQLDLFLVDDGKTLGVRRLALNKLTDSCAKELASTVSTNQSLMHLNLGGNSFTDRSVSSLLHLIRTCKSLQEIDLNDNYLGDSGVRFLCETLMNPDCKIERLGLWRNQFSSNGARQLESLRSLRPNLFVYINW
ncbi:NACHT, LRR and PYD domains-containing protein 3-like isoform X2 [Chiloscyllium plagiosum]|uniref:NACHT, LRR and PYD domains-containing protein 3-like isoform X2 n=1 Tax=Chiloscyllium plagiosum TaxID=36176 RepID=UPI001CB85836|nr:NACHT, LRR and PYD domains-containing protein 3-like isoform X2 [Chiloscyllium plagiosum]